MIFITFSGLIINSDAIINPTAKTRIARAILNQAPLSLPLNLTPICAPIAPPNSKE